MGNERCVILFVRLLEKGKVKSRLAKDLGEDLVLRLYESMVLDTIGMLKKGTTPFRICFDPPHALDRMQKWLGNEYSYMPQTGNDLGERMELAFAHVFSEGISEALLIGSDIPGLTIEMIDDAFRSFASHDAVIGPANDGGYYLIGFRNTTFEPSIFRTMSWSTDAVYRTTRERLRARMLKVHVLPECIDADTKEDLQALLARNPVQDVPDTRTITLLKRHRNSIVG
jgi:rSAM/selenodomain-associated transferase 1